MAKGMLVLALLWWAWTGYAWLTSVIDPEEGAVRLVMIAAMAGLLLVALCVPQAFDDRAVDVRHRLHRRARRGRSRLFLIASRETRTFAAPSSGSASAPRSRVACCWRRQRSTRAAGRIWWCRSSSTGAGPPSSAWPAGASFPATSPSVTTWWSSSPSASPWSHSGSLPRCDLGAAVIAAVVLGIGLASALWWTYFDVVSLVTAGA